MTIKNYPLVIGISLPIIFTIIISIIVFLPSLFIKPQYNFIYSIEDNFYRYEMEYKNTIQVENEIITVKPVNPNEDMLQTNEIMPQMKTTLNFYLYNVEANTTHQITLEEAQSYSVDPGPSSPDGYIVAYQYGHGGIFELFGSNSGNSGYFISKGNRKKKLLGLSGDKYWNQGGFRFIGWIK